MNNPLHSGRQAPLYSCFKMGLLALLCGLAFCQPAQAGLFDDKEARRQVAELKKENIALSEKISLLQTALDALSARLVQNETKAVEINSTEIMPRLEMLKIEQGKMRGEQEVFSYKQEQMEKRQQDLYADLDQRVRVLEAPLQKSREQEAQENTAFSAAQALSQNGQYVEAASSWQQFVQTYPQSLRSDEAWYALGFAQLAQRDCPSAMPTLQKVLFNYPKSSKAGDALVAIGACQSAQNDKIAAKKTFKAVLAQYPNTPAAEQALRQLNNIK